MYVNKFLPQISAAIAGSHDRAFPGWKRVAVGDFPPQSLTARVSNGSFSLRPASTDPAVFSSQSFPIRFW
ncbi:MAG TPA: hypothetical protein VIK19_08105, partial [Syntrophales bacterium]